MSTIKKSKVSKVKVKKTFIDVEVVKNGVMIKLFRLLNNNREVVITHLFTNAFLSKVSKLSLGQWEEAKQILQSEISKFWKNSYRGEEKGWTRVRDIHNAIVKELNRSDLAFYYGKYAQVHNDKRLAICESFKDAKSFVNAQVEA